MKVWKKKGMSAMLKEARPACHKVMSKMDKEHG
jgi:hypothetical protein